MSSQPQAEVSVKQATVAPLINDLNGLLRSSSIEVEFYFMGGAVLFQAFDAAPRTAHISAMFKPAATVHAAAAELARRESLPDGWLQESVRTALEGAVHTGAYVDLSHVRMFVPLPAYVLAVKCAALRLAADLETIDDVRYVLRAMNIKTADQAMAVVSQYFTDRQLAPRTQAVLEDLLGA